jgi:chromosome segregation ATPase
MEGAPVGEVTAVAGFVAVLAYFLKRAKSQFERDDQRSADLDERLTERFAFEEELRVRMQQLDREREEIRVQLARCEAQHQAAQADIEELRGEVARLRALVKGEMP